MIEALSNGMGAQSMLLLHMACQDQIPARFSITADTGSEEDNILSDGSRITARNFFERHIKPMARKGGIGAFFVRAKLDNGSPIMPLHEHMAAYAGEHDNVPLFGSDMGRLRQTCTDKWKLRAIKQQLRELGAKMAQCAIGLHADEYMRRRSGILEGKFTHRNLSYAYYQTTVGKETPKKHAKRIKWLWHYYPIVDWQLGRDAVRDKLNKLGIPYLISSECDHCPHKDDTRWLASSQETIDRVALLEERYKGEFFFTDRRIPLKLAIEDMRRHPRASTDPTFGCKNGLCGV